MDKISSLKIFKIFLPGGLGAKETSFGALLVTFGILIEIGITIFLVFRIIAYIQLGALAFISMVSFAKSKSNIHD